MVVIFYGAPGTNNTMEQNPPPDNYHVFAYEPPVYPPWVAPQGWSQIPGIQPNDFYPTPPDQGVTPFTWQPAPGEGTVNARYCCCKS